MINPRSDRAVYRQLADVLRDQIASGQIKPGGMLPSIKAMEQTYGVSRETIRRTLAVLRSEGLIVTEPGYGTRVREPEQREQVRVPRGAQVISRPATHAERLELDVAEGGHVLVVTVGGRERGRWPADRTTLTFA